MKTNPELIDDENPEWTDENFKNAVPFSELPKSLQTLLSGKPEIGETSVTMNLSMDVLQAFQAMGANWQVQINQALREWLAAHTV
jgi:uncharacterized protein (DUF4415 family)